MPKHKLSGPQPAKGSATRRYNIKEVALAANVSVATV
jgi:hypothetical protein